MVHELYCRVAWSLWGRDVTIGLALTRQHRLAPQGGAPTLASLRSVVADCVLKCDKRDLQPKHEPLGS